MALVLTLVEGEDFYVQNDQIVLSKIVSAQEIVITRMRDNKQFTLKEGRAIELFKDVFVSVGSRGQLGLARIAVEAPRSVVILRGARYRDPTIRK